MTITLSPSPELAERLLAANTADDVQAIIGKLARPVWKPLGGKPNNLPQVEVISDPGDGLVERVTNAFDAVTELEVALSGRTDLMSPREAADQLLGVSGGHVADMKDGEKRDTLARRVMVTVRDSGASKEPTIVVRDSGIGQHPDDFESTLVSLNEQNKLTKLYLMGAYGWGGAGAFQYCQAAILVSRRDPRLLGLGQADEVGWTIVRYNSLEDDLTTKHGRYEYLCVDEGDGPVIPRLAPSELPESHRGWAGTNCTLVRYELSRYSDAAWRPKGSLWLLFNAALFDPVMPFYVRDERQKSVEGRRGKPEFIVYGNAARLSRDQEKKEDNQRVALRGQWYRKFNDGGAVTIHYYVLELKGDAKADWEPTITYVPREQAIILTNNGQRQGSYRRELFDKFGRSGVSKFLIVHVDCDALSRRAKRELFSTTRDRLKDSPVAQQLLDEVEIALRSDPDLKALDRARKEQALARHSRDQAERIKKLLQNAISSLRQGMEIAYKKVDSSNPDLPLLSDQLLIDESKPVNPPQPPIPPLQFTGEPTQLVVLNPSVRIPAGGKAVVRLRLDAPDGYITAGDAAPGGGGTFTARVTKGGEAFRVEGVSSLTDGMMRCTISAEKGSPRDRGRVVFGVIPRVGLPLFADAELEAIEPPQTRVKPVGKMKGRETGPNVEPVHRDQWEALGFDEKRVAKVEENYPDAGLTTIYVNYDYPPLDERLLKERRFDEQAIPAHKERFVASMAFTAWLQREDKVASIDVADAELRRAAQVFLMATLLESV